ncbi:hypothetical protein [Cytobacillus oceanisediminis]|uniref:hypothetical protein n=1 Tax=Cytobacillus oceanisediminis TaxID=665099 RepID=UPI001FB2E218|nr:hypothetical protein [Cytobacillus oceanisediminis]UOE58161.1 hypothetical protein IRB79_27020 [Cytobacillus oceanisediminis]
MLIEWKLVEANKWVGKVGPSDFVIVIINPLENGKYELKYIDAPFDNVKDYEIENIVTKYGLSPEDQEQIALKLFDTYYGEYEWILVCDSRDELVQELLGGTSFDITLLKDLKEPQEQKSFSLSTEHVYDLWDDNDGNLAYLFTDSPPDEMNSHVGEFINKSRNESKEEIDPNDFLDWLRTEKDVQVIVVNRPNNGINLNP